MAQSVPGRCAGRLGPGPRCRLAGAGLIAGLIAVLMAASMVTPSAMSAVAASSNVASANAGGPVYPERDGLGDEIADAQASSAVPGRAPATYVQSAVLTSQLVSQDPVAGVVPITVMVPPTGGLTVTAAAGVVNLQGPSFPDTTATGTLQAVTVTDTRNYAPGWSVSAQVSDFTGSGEAAGHTIPAAQLGWAPTGTLAAGAVLGPAIAPASPGLGSPAVLASALADRGFGTTALSAELTLEVPRGSKDGAYLATMTITVVATGP